MRFVLLIMVFLLTKFTSAQDLTGIWRGSFISTVGLQYLLNPNERYKLEVQLDQHDKVFNSVTYSYKSTVFYGKATANGTFNPKTGKVWLEELKIVEVKMQYPSSACVMTYRLQYSKNEDEQFLEGTWSGYEEGSAKPCGKGTVLLRKVYTSDFYKEPFLTQRELEKKNRLAMVPKKKTEPLTKKSSVVKPGIKSPVTKKTGAPVAKINSGKPAVRTPSKKPDNSTAVKPPATKNTNPPSVAKTNPGKNSPVLKPGSQKPPVKTPGATIQPFESKMPATVPQIAETDTLKKSIPQFKKAPPLIIPKVLANRENELVKTIVINTNEISINLYDNGTVDHDTVSVYFDKKLVISRQMLTTSPINYKFTMDENNSVHELVMVAENEGDIPPNTSLMVVRAGDKEYEVRITSTEQKNAVIIFKYEKK